MPTVPEMKAFAAHMKGPEAEMLKGMITAMEKGDPKMKQQMEGFWKMLNGMAESTPEEYKTYIDSQMKEMEATYEKERKAEEERFNVESQPHFCFCIKPARIIPEEERA